jgi:uncharacterized membrane protein HdeD (DUF308 family)
MSASSVDESVDPMLSQLARSWGLVLVWGLITIAMGAALLAWPKETLLVVAVLVGIWLIISGVLQLVGAFGPGLSGGARALFLISAVLSLIIGVVLVNNVISPDLSNARALALLSLLIGAGWLVQGISELFGALAHKDMEGRGWAIFSGLLGIVASVIILAWPLQSLAVLATVTGVLLLIIGAFRVGSAFALRGRAKSAA